MNVRNHQRDRVVERLSAHLLETGLSQISLRQLAAAAGVSDRMLLYYFEDKAEVLAATMARIAADLTRDLAEAIPGTDPLPPLELLKRATAVSTQPVMRRFLRLWIEVVAATAKGEAPFTMIAPQLMTGFQMWIGSRLDLPEGADREAVVAAIIAMIDGLALVGICTNDDLVTRAADAVGLFATPPIAPHPQ